MKQQKPAKEAAIDTQQAPEKPALQTETAGASAPPPSEKPAPRARGRHLRTIGQGEACLAHNIREVEAQRRHPNVANAVTNATREWLASKRATREQDEIVSQLQELREAIEAAGHREQESRSTSIENHTGNSAAGNGARATHRTHDA